MGIMTARIYIAGPISGRPVAEYTHLAEHSPSEWLRALARARVRAR